MISLNQAGKNVGCILAILFILLLSATVFAGEPGTAVRTLPAHYMPGVPIDVNIDVTPLGNTSVWGFWEYFPSGWTVKESDINCIIANGTYCESSGINLLPDHIEWLVINDTPIQRTLTYKITPNSESTGIKDFNGTSLSYKLDDSNYEFILSGDTNISDSNHPVSILINFPAPNSNVRKIVHIDANAEDFLFNKVIDLNYYLDGNLILGEDLNTSPDLNTFVFNDGPHTITVSAVDSFGNFSSSDVNVIIDNTPPTQPIVTATFGADRNIHLDWGTALREDTDFYNIYDTNFPDTNVFGFVDFTFATNASGPVHNGDGNYCFFIQAVDFVGNDSNSATVCVLVDTAPPVISINFPLQDSVVRGSLPVDASASDGLSGLSGDLNYYLDGFLLSTKDLNTLDFSDGLHTITVSAIDLNGNSSSKDVNFVIDNTLPVISNFTAAISTANNVLLNYLASDGNGSGIAMYQIRMNDNNWVDNNLNTSYSGFSGLANADYNFYVRAIDYAGNVSLIADNNLAVNYTPADNGNNNNGNTGSPNTGYTGSGTPLSTLPADNNAKDVNSIVPKSAPKNTANINSGNNGNQNRPQNGGTESDSVLPPEPSPVATGLFSFGTTEFPGVIAVGCLIVVGCFAYFYLNGKRPELGE